MKKICILIISLMTFLSVKSQQVPLSNIINFNPPNSIKKSTNENLKSIKSNSIGGRTMMDMTKLSGEFYTAGDMVIHLNGAVGVSTTNHLEKLKKGWDEIFKHDKSATNYTSTIKSINNYKVLILNYDVENKGNSHYDFYCISNSHDKALSGSIEYSNSDKEQAANLYKELSNSIEFK